MGLNGAFLTGDLFNLFVFFEVMLAASYGMALHGSGTARVRAGLHYIVVNLVASLLFLVGVSVVYGIAGTLNMADLATRMRDVAPEDRALLEAGLAVLGVAFLVKAAMWPLGFWLPGTYAAASAPAAAILSILSKVGVYAVLRVWLLLFGDDGGGSAGFGGAWLTLGGLLTIAFGSVAALASQAMARLAGASVLVSSGTLLAAIGMGQAAVTGGALLYLASSVLAIGAFFLLIELAERGREVGADVLAVTREAFGTGEEDEEGDPEARDAVGVPIPGTVAALGISFLACALLLAGLPPLSGFLAKFAMLAPLLAPGEAALPATTWVLLAALVLSGLATVIAMVRTGIDVFWASPAGTQPRVGLIEFLPVALLLALCGALTVGAGPAMEYMSATAEALHAPEGYLRGVLGSLATTPEPRP
jgi:multicomponent K+:H+ antiporter subunit D